LAVPAFATLVSEPALLLADSAIIGHLGTTQLAGLGIAANLLGILTGLSVFLAYGTTATVARRLGAGDRRAALSGGVDGIVLAVLLGVVLAIALQLLMPMIIS
jgi:Na+-driven multidrug efflux pump